MRDSWRVSSNRPNQTENPVKALKFLMAPSHQKYFSSDGHRMAIRQNGFLYNTIQHSHTSDAERMEIRFRDD